MDKHEIWKDCKGYEGKYQVSNLGRVWSIVKQQYKSIRYDKDGYARVTLVAKNGKMVVEKVHRLVAIAFIDNPNNYPVVNHLDSNRVNNCVENLEWTDVKGNTKHGYDNGAVKSAQQAATEAARAVNTKVFLVYQNGVLIGEYRGALAAAGASGVSEATVRLCVKEKRSTRTGYTFEVKEVVSDAKNKS